MLSQVGGTFLKLHVAKKIIPETRHYLHQTHYETLGLQRNCTTKEVKEAFIKLSKRYHPDKNTQKSSHNKFVKIVEAYNVLSKADSRRLYDQQILYRSPPAHEQYHYSNARPRRSSRTRGFSYDDPSFWANRDRTKDKNYDEYSYYGIPGIKRMSNGFVALICVFFTAIGVTLQYFAIRHSMTLKRDVMAKQSMENEEILAKIQEEATKNGNELQIELMERRLLKNRFYTQFNSTKSSD